MLAAMAVVLIGANALAQDSAANSQSSAAVSAPAPSLSYGMMKIMELSQAKISTDTILAFIDNSGNTYDMTADQIIYLHQQGVSDVVLSAMLKQNRTGWANPAAAAAPSAAYRQTAPDTIGYSQPYNDFYYQPYYNYYCYPNYSWYPPVTFSYGWNGGWGRNWYGGWHGGVIGNGWHSSGFGSFGHGGATSGGWHGGGSSIGGSHGSAPGGHGGGFGGGGHSTGHR